MKTFTTLLLILTVSAEAIAHSEMQPKVATSIVTESINVSDQFGDITSNTSTNDSSIVRLYRRENTLVQKALDFCATVTSAKLA